MFPDVERVTREARCFILRYLERLGGGPRLERPLDETVSMCSQLCPEFRCCCSIGSPLNEVMSYEKEHFRERSGNG